MSQFQALTSSTGYGASKNKAGVISGPDKYVGVTLADIIKEIGGMTDAQSVKLTASDNFTKTLTYKQVYQGDFNIMDEAGNPAVASLKPYILLAYSKNGNVLDAGVGPIQAVIISAYSQVSEASIWVKAVVKIEVISP
jgi:DMSO/TMAO reductase YedYZ molybdopterin-dependent catalytic subunit